MTIRQRNDIVRFRRALRRIVAIFEDEIKDTDGAAVGPNYREAAEEMCDVASAALEGPPT